MGYHMTILRTLKQRQLDITLNEARSAAENTSGWQYDRVDECFTFTGPQGTIDVFHDEGELWLQDFHGEAWQLEPMLALANTLNARVRGDELETYESIDKTYFHPDDTIIRKEARIAGKEIVEKGLRESKRIRNIIVGFFVILGIIAFIVGKQFEQ